ncbi:hypothetical protein VTH82DRAFT_8003 [Thermothelomyces myriococcoides]
MASTMVATHYASGAQSLHYPYMPPPSPPMDETAKCSLPSISNLLGLADQGSPTSETSPQSQQQQPQPQPQQQQQQQQSQVSKPDTRPSSSHYGNPTMLRTGLPPSPPMSSDASFEGFNSPSTRSVSQVPNSSNYYFETTPPLQVEADTRQMNTTAAVPRVSVQPPAYQAQFAGSAYASQPAVSSYYSPIQATGQSQTQVSSLYYQRPLPQSFPPPVPMSVTLAPATGNPWQHHHYIAPSASASFPQSQDRYICQTCHKAFSRPSSLRIHSHSHTGEKPFKCPFPGCGKAFSVRSNMKRHERGCHNYDSNGSGSGNNSTAAAVATVAGSGAGTNPTSGARP